MIIPGYWIQSVAMGDREEHEELFHQVTPTSFLVIGVYIYIYDLSSVYIQYIAKPLCDNYSGII